MTFIEMKPEAEADGLLKRIYDAAIQRNGSVAHIIQIMSLDPESCKTSMRFYASLMKSPNSVDPATRELLATIVSRVNMCFY